MKIYTYLIKSLKDKNYYTGISKNPNHRLTEHNLGKVTATKNKRPYILVYYKEHFSYIEARKHEQWLKKKNKQYKDNLSLLFSRNKSSKNSVPS